MLHALLSEKPKVPEYPLIDFGAEQNAATQENLRALPGLEKLASRVNEFSSSEMLKGLETMFPGYSSILAKGTEILKSQMRGEIPEDVQRQIGRTSAERSRAGGYAGSDFAGNLQARDLGLTSLDIINQSLSTAERWMQEAAQRTPQFNFTSMFVTPQQRIAVKVQENQAKFQRDWVANQIAALPEPWEQALINLADNIEEIGQSVLSAYAGGAVGGGMGGMGGGGGGGGTSASTGYGNYSIPTVSSSQSFSDVSGTYSSGPPVQSYPLPPENYQYQNSYSGHPAWYP